MTIRKSLIDNNLTSDSYYVKAVTQHFQDMDKSFQEDDYDNVVNYAKSMIESALKYVHRVLTGKNISKKTTSLVEQAKQTFDAFKLNNPNDEIFSNTFNNLNKVILGISRVRNSTSISHGGEDSNQRITCIQARFIYVTSIAVSNFLLDLLFERTNSFSDNIVGGKINKNSATIQRSCSYDQGNSITMYKDESNKFMTVEYFCNGLEIITKVELILSKAISTDRNEIEEHITDYIEPDADFVRPKSEHCLIYHSDKRSIYYNVNIYDEGKTIIVDIIGEGLEKQYKN
ncbi:MAG: abortive infection family protein [Oenococcus oeni]